MKGALSILLILFCVSMSAQSRFFEFYPISDDPNIRLMSSYSEHETIIFEANPTVRYSFYNNFTENLMDSDKRISSALYLHYKPQLRMYNDGSLPVKTPSYRILLGTQYLFRIKNRPADFWGFSFESGHYSNGQGRCAFSQEYADGSSECYSLYETLNEMSNLSQMLNRTSGNFSTNLSELLFNYRSYGLDDNKEPENGISVNIGYLLYHDKFLFVGDFGGYSDQDIELYGKHRFLFDGEYLNKIPKINRRFTVKQNLEYIQKPHKSVEPWRSETQFTIYPIQRNPRLGFFVSYIHGHDNYNFRFVDSGNQVAVGVSWDQFPPMQMSSDLD